MDNVIDRTSGSVCVETKSHDEFFFGKPFTNYSKFKIEYQRERRRPGIP